MIVSSCLLAACTNKTTLQPPQTSEWAEDSVAFCKQMAEWTQKLVHMTEAERIMKAERLIADEADNPGLQLRLYSMAEDYFNNPNSPYRNEDIYIAVLEALIEAPDIDSIDKVRPRFQLEQTMKNRPGTMAADLSLLTVHGKRLSLSDINADYTLLYFFNPECHDCKRVTQHIATSALFLNLQNRGHLKVLAVYPDEDLTAWEKQKHEHPATWTVARFAPEQDREAYNLPAIPNLYLLDKDKRIVLKDAPIEQIEYLLATAAI